MYEYFVLCILDVISLSRTGEFRMDKAHGVGVYHHVKEGNMYTGKPYKGIDYSKHHIK